MEKFTQCLEDTVSLQKTVTEESSRIFFEENVVTGKYQQNMVERIDEQYGVAPYLIAMVY